MMKKVKRYEIRDNADGLWMIWDNQEQEHLHDDFGDGFDTEEQAQEWLEENYDADEEIVIHTDVDGADKVSTEFGDYDVLRRHHDIDGQYFYIWNNKLNRAEQDEDGDILHFDTYDEAVEYVEDLISSNASTPRVTATAEVKDAMFVVYDTSTGRISNQFFDTDKRLYAIYPTKAMAETVAELLNANGEMEVWKVAQIKSVELI